MSPAPSSPRAPNDFSPPALSNPSSLSINAILSRAPRTPHDGPVGPFTADRRASFSFRRSFSGGPRLPPFERQTVTLNEPGNLPSVEPGNDSMNTRTLLQSALEAQHRRMEERRMDHWRAQSSLPRISRTALSDQRRRRIVSLQPELTTASSGPMTPEVRPATPSRRYVSSPRIFISNDSSESESDTDDDPENKFSSSSITNFPRSSPPTALTPQSSLSSQSLTSSLKQGDEDPSRNAYTLSCRFCANLLTSRGMRARLVADARVHIWSTDHRPNVKLVGDKYATSTCQCELVDIACTRCNTVVGYHIAGSKPCATCSRSNHNAHYHLLRTSQTIGIQNMNPEGCVPDRIDILTSVER